VGHGDHARRIGEVERALSLARLDDVLPFTAP
jgi:hypothetical protein